MLRQALQICHGEIVELVALPSSKTNPIMVCYCAAEDIERCGALASGQPGYSGVYICSGRINAAITARYGVLGEWVRATAGRASDGDIVARRVLYIDVDAQRPSGISATDAELEAAKVIARKVLDILIPVVGKEATSVGMSGNGWSIFVSCEQSADTSELKAGYRALLGALARGFGPAIDTTVHNPSRLVPLFGTRKCKGADTPERPHRETRIIRAATQTVPWRVLF